MQWLFTTGTHPDFLHLAAGGASGGGCCPFHQITDAVLGYTDAGPAVCGGLRLFGGAAAQVCCVCLTPAYRPFLPLLLERLEQAAVRSGYQKLLIRMEPEEADQAPLYRRCGFAEMRLSFFPDDSVWLQKVILP